MIPIAYLLNIINICNGVLGELIYIIIMNICKNKNNIPKQKSSLCHVLR